MRKSPVFLQNYSVQQKIRAWHEQLHEQRGHGRRALLRRCVTPQDILMQPPFYALYVELYPLIERSILRDHEDGLLAMAAITGLLAHIKVDTVGAGFASQLKSNMSELRFGQLQKSRDWDEFYRHLRRAVQLLEKNVDIIALADGILHWAKDRIQRDQFIDAKPADKLLIRWAMQYFGDSSDEKDTGSNE